MNFHLTIDHAWSITKPGVIQVESVLDLQNNWQVLHDDAWLSFIRLAMNLQNQHHNSKSVPFISAIAFLWSNSMSSFKLSRDSAIVFYLLNSFTSLSKLHHSNFRKAVKQDISHFSKTFPQSRFEVSPTCWPIPSDDHFSGMIQNAWNSILITNWSVLTIAKSDTTILPKQQLQRVDEIWPLRISQKCKNFGIPLPPFHRRRDISKSNSSIEIKISFRRPWLFVIQV